MQAKNQQIQEMFRTIPDPRLRKQLADIMNSKATHMVYCMSEKCKGRLIAMILDTGAVSAISNDKGEAFLRASRHRLDGHMGFECWCGNDSRLAKQEKGHIGAVAPSKTALEKVWQNVQNKPSEYPVVNGKQLIDGFEIRGNV
jgi:hypothetical protein